MAIDDDKRRIPSLVPPNGGRAPGGPFDPASFTRAPRAAAPAAPPVNAYDVGRQLRGGADAAVAMTRPLLQAPLAPARVASQALPTIRRAVAGFTGAPEPAASAPAAGGTPVARAAGTVASAVPTLATVTPENAANASALRGLTRPGFGAVRGGAGTTSGTPAVSDSGRALGYGNRVDGVNVFSDGSGNGPAATMTRPQIDALANGDRISVADAGIGGNIASEAFRRARPVVRGSAADRVLAGTLELGGAQSAALTRPQQGGVFHMPSAQVRAADDALAAANRDPRSKFGRAARNADVRANSGFGTPFSRAEAYQADLGAIDRAITGRAAAEQEMAKLAQEESGETERVGINAQAEVAKAALTRPGPSPIDLADGTLGAVGSDGVVRPITDAKGQPARRAQTRDDASAKRTQELTDALAKQAGELLAATLPVGQAPTPEQIAAARLQSAQLNGLRTATGPNGERVVEINGEWTTL